MTRQSESVRPAPSGSRRATMAAAAILVALVLVGILASPSHAISTRTLVSPTGPGILSDFGGSVAPAGDVNGDGYPDVVVGASTANGNTGAVYIYFGGPVMHATPDVILTGEASGDRFGISISTAGDVNGDGYPDLIVGADAHLNGRAYIFYGGPGLVSKGAVSADVILTGETSGGGFGISVAAAGDVNGDGRPDVIVGANLYPSTFFIGRAYVFFGGPGLVSKGAASAEYPLGEPM